MKNEGNTGKGKTGIISGRWRYIWGSITQVPDSQKLFGALMYMFAERYGDERAADLVSAVMNKEIHLALSNIMPEGYLPAPKDYLKAGN